MGREKLLGFQLANKKGEIIQGSPSDPTKLKPHEIMSFALSLYVVANHTEFILYPIYDDDDSNDFVVVRPFKVEEWMKEEEAA
jgi:hypothetical protein